MKAKKEAFERYEDAMFTLIMEEIMAEEGERLEEENRRLRSDPEFSIPEDADRRSLKTIERALGRRGRGRAVRSAWRVFQRVSVAVFAGLLLFTGVYAAFPTVRTATLNLLIEASNVSTNMSFNDGERTQAAATERGMYELSEIPDGFELSEAGDDGLCYWRIYTDKNGNKITLEVMDASIDIIHQLDIEGAESVEDIEVNGNKGSIVIKGDWMRITLADTNNHVFIDITCHGLTKENVLNVVFSLNYT